MRKSTFLLLIFAIGFTQISAQDFSGTWRLKTERPEVGSLPEAPEAVLKVEHRAGVIRCAAAGGAEWAFTTDGKESSTRAGAKTLNTIAKWEGSALLINTIVSGPGRSYTQMERWRLSRDGAVLTVTREIVQRPVNAEATLVYMREGAAQPAPAAQASAAQASAAQPPAPEAPRMAAYIVDAGTRIPLTLINSVSTKQSSEGDRVYLSTSFPILSNGRVVIPPGSYVAGTLTFVKRPGRVRGRGELYLRFDSLTLPNGVTRDFRSRVGALDGETAGELDRKEGNIKGEGNKSGDARSVGEATAAGASVGAIAGAAADHPGMGLGIGAAAGAAAGVVGVLLSRGPDIVLARGSSLEMILDRKLSFRADELEFPPAPPRLRR